MAIRKTIAEGASAREKSPPARPAFPWGKYQLCAALTSAPPLLFGLMSLSGSSGDIGRWHDIAEFLLVSSFLLMLIFEGNALWQLVSFVRKPDLSKVGLFLIYLVQAANCFGGEAG